MGMVTTKSPVKLNTYRAIVLYSLIFILIRLFTSQYGMTFDEAEQFLDAKNYVLGYSDQPPLYSWILKTVSYIFGLNVMMMMMVYHAIVMGFLIYLYKITNLVFNSERKALYCFLSYTLFFIYSYDFYRYTIHTALMMLLCVLSLYTYLKIYYQKASWLNYFSLGLCFALGLLSKYNFIFFIVTLVLGSLFTQKTREILFNTKTIFAVLICFVILTPHFLWMFNNDFAPIHYALKRGEAGAGEQEFSLISVLLNTYWNYLVYIAAIIILFFQDINKKITEEKRFFLSLFALAVLIPFILIIVLKAGNFSQRWLAPLNIFLPLAIFSFIELGARKWQYNVFKIGIVILIIIFYSMRIGSYYFRNDTKPSIFCRPYQALYLNLKNDLYSSGIDWKNKNFQIYSFKEINIMAAMNSFHKDLEVQMIYPRTKGLEFSDDLIIFSKDNKKSFEKFVKENKLQYRILFSKSAPYLHSSGKLHYKMNFALIE